MQQRHRSPKVNAPSSTLQLGPNPSSAPVAPTSCCWASHQAPTPCIPQHPRTIFFSILSSTQKHHLTFLQNRESPDPHHRQNWLPQHLTESFLQKLTKHGSWMKSHFPALHASPSPTYLSGVQLPKLPLLSQKTALLRKGCSMPPPCSQASPIMVALPHQLQLVTVIAGRCAPSCVGGLSGAKGSIWGSSELQGWLLWLQELLGVITCLVSW